MCCTRSKPSSNDRKAGLTSLIKSPDAKPLAREPGLELKEGALCLERTAAGLGTRQGSVWLSPSARSMRLAHAPTFSFPGGMLPGAAACTGAKDLSAGWTGGWRNDEVAGSRC